MFGANTDVGKTLLTSALVRASAARGKETFYLKPASTGPLSDADDELVFRQVLSRTLTLVNSSGLNSGMSSDTQATSRRK